MDIRQSEPWAIYLTSLGWKSFRTSKGINIEVRPTILGSFVKIQKCSKLDAEDLTEIENICREHGAEFIKIEPYVGQDVSVLKSAGYEVSWFPMSPPSTYFINLNKSESDLWASVSHSGKYRINRSRREGARTEVVRNPSKEQLEKFYKVLKFTGRQKKFYVPPIKQLFAQAKAFGENGFIIFVYDKDKNLDGAKWYCAFGDNVLYVSGGTTESGRTNHSGYELLWQSILYFKKLGFTILDLEGKDDVRFPGLTADWGGFSHFKEKFGPEAIEFPLPHVKYLSPVFRFLHKVIGFAV